MNAKKLHMSVLYCYYSHRWSLHIKNSTRKLGILLKESLFFQTKLLVFSYMKIEM
jgi:hypothetical protein